MKKKDIGFIVIEGPIGVGKTTLAKKLANSLGYDIYLEKYQNNPFLKMFYTNPEKYALATQLHFLIHRSNDLMIDNGIFNGQNLVSDFFIQKDKLFAKTILNKEEYDLYLSIEKNLKISYPIPNLVIYLQANNETLHDRIRTRNHEFEKNIDFKYLNNINEAYTKFFYSYKESPLLIINTSSVNVNNDKDYSHLLKEINRSLTGRNFLNPSGVQ